MKTGQGQVQDKDAARLVQNKLFQLNEIDEFWVEVC